MPDLATQYERLVAIAQNAREYVFADGDRYTGPVRPAGILSQSLHMDGNPNNGIYYYLAISEHVPNELFEWLDNSLEYPTGVVLAKLSGNFEFIEWTPQTKTLGSIMYQESVPGGTMEGVCTGWSGRNFTWEIIYKPGREQPKPNRAPSQVKRFDPDEYVKSGWKSAVEAECNHYARLGLNPQDHVTATQVRSAHAARAAWWTQLSKQAESGRNNPRIAELSPHCRTAIRNLQDAADVLADVDKKIAYDRQLEAAEAEAVEGKFLEFVKFTLRDNVLTAGERNDLFDQARDLGLSRERAEELIHQEILRAGATEGNAPSPDVSAQSGERSQNVGSDKPRLVVGESSLSFGTLRQGEKRERIVSIDNKGGGTLSGSVHSSHPDWLLISQTELDTRRHHQDIVIKVETRDLNLGEKYVGAIQISSNGGREAIRVDLAIELEATAVRRFRKNMFWIGAVLGSVVGMASYALLPVRVGNVVTEIAGLIGGITLVAVCAMIGGWGGGIGGFFLASILQSILANTTMLGYSGIAWAETASGFLFFWARPLLIERLAGNGYSRRLWAAGTGMATIVCIILLGAAVASKMTGSESPRNNEQGIVRALSIYQRAILNRDAEAAARCYAPVVRGYYLDTNVARSSVLADYQRKFRRYLEVDEFGISNIHFLSITKTSATVTFDQTWNFEGPRPYAGDEKAQMVFRKMNGKWKIIANCDVELYQSQPATHLRNEASCLAVSSSRSLSE